MSEFSNEKRWCATHERLESMPSECFRTLEEQSSIADKYNAFTRAHNGQHDPGCPNADRRLTEADQDRRIASQIEKTAIERLGMGSTRIIFENGEIQVTDQTLRDYRPTVNDEMALQGYIQHNFKK